MWKSFAWGPSYQIKHRMASQNHQYWILNNADAAIKLDYLPMAMQNPCKATVMLRFPAPAG
jgi:hypothetical protein